MCTNMEFNELIKVVDEALPQEVSCSRLEKTMLKAHIVQLLESYSQTTTSYLTTNYHQIIGASMGAFPSSGICDIRLYQTLEQPSEKSPHKNKLNTHARFRDDRNITCEVTPAHDVANFFQTANYFHTLLRFTRTTSTQEITFLDTSV